MGQIENFQGLEVWQRAHQLTLAVYRVTKGFPADERYGLVSTVYRLPSTIKGNRT